MFFSILKYFQCSCVVYNLKYVSSRLLIHNIITCFQLRNEHNNAGIYFSFISIP